MNENEEELKRLQADWKAPEQTPTEFKGAAELVAESSFEEWCQLNAVDDSAGLNIKKASTFSEKEKVYDAAFRLGQRKLMTELRDPNNDAVKLFDKLDLKGLKADLASLRERGDISELSAKEAEIASLFQQAISGYSYSMETCHIAEILNKKEMNCVGASVLGGALFEEVGIKYLVGHIGNHVLLVPITSNGRVLWQDMQDGLEIPELANEELTQEKVDGSSPQEIVSFANNPTKDGLKFSVRKEYWKDQTMTVLPPDVGLELQELISTGFILGNSGRNDEAIEILEIAKLKAPNDIDVHLGLARAYKNQKKYGDALSACQKAVSLDQNNAFLTKMLSELNQLAVNIP